MKINKVILTDYRSHKGEHTFEFTDGINLLLGRNGAGKSSILEAVGLAMFNTGNRSSNDDAVNFSAKTAIINVDFEGIDGIQYIVEKKIGATNTVKLFQKGEKYPREQGVNDVENKIKELAGIELSSDKIYENILTAYQNKMTDIFSETGSKRQITFNQIFNTAIYKEISDKFVKKSEEKYELLKSNNSTLLNDKNAQLMDSVQLKNDLDEAVKTKENFEKEVEVIAFEISELDKIEAKLKDSKNKIDRISNDIKHNSELLKNQSNSKTETQIRLESSQKALDIVNINEVSYKSYLIKSDESNSVSKEIDRLEIKEKQKQNFEKNLNSNNNEQTKLIEQSKGFELNLNEKQVQYDIIKNEIDKLHLELETETILKNKIDSDLNLVIKDKEIFDSLYNQYLGFVKNLENQNFLLSDIQKQKFDFVEIENKLNEYENFKLELKGKNDSKKELSNQIEVIKTRLKDNEDARKKLSTGICPFLKNDCLNIKSGSSAEDFFGSRKNELMIDYEKYSIELKQYSELEKLISENENNITLIKKQKDDGLKNETQIKDYRNKIELTNKDIEIIELKLSDFLKNYESKTSQIFENKDFKEAENFLINNISDIKGKFQIQNTKIQALQTNLKNKNQDKSNIGNSIINLNKSIEDNLYKLQTLREKENDLKIQINMTDELIKSLPELKNQRLTINQDLEHFKTGYNNYIANKKNSEEIPTHTNKLNELEINIQKLNQDNERFVNLLNELSSEYSETTLVDIQNNLKEKKLLEKEYEKKLSEVNTIITIKKDSLDRNNKLEIEIKDLNHIIKHIDLKLKLTKEFRDKLKIMGKLVANRLLAKIEHIATENYRRISGRAEQITWTNDEKDDYLVSLIQGQNIRKFEQLSGGEQVTVAISLRSAMASILSKANFAIFDEPTNNLDSERKSALAESLQDLLKNLKQAIIVTHDNSFEEMAQNIINLDK